MLVGREGRVDEKEGKREEGGVLSCRGRGERDGRVQAVFLLITTEMSRHNLRTSTTARATRQSQDRKGGTPIVHSPSHSILLDVPLHGAATGLEAKELAAQGGGAGDSSQRHGAASKQGNQA